MAVTLVDEIARIVDLIATQHYFASNTKVICCQALLAPSMNEAQLARRQDRLRHFPTLLTRWAGAHARIAELDRSCPRALRIEFTRPESAGFLLLACIYPEFIHGPTEWPNAHVTVTLTPDGEGFIVRDAAADVSIVTGSVEIAEHHDHPRNA